MCLQGRRGHITLLKLFSGQTDGRSFLRSAQAESVIKYTQMLYHNHHIVYSIGKVQNIKNRYHCSPSWFLDSRNNIQEHKHNPNIDAYGQSGTVQNFPSTCFTLPIFLSTSFFAQQIKACTSFGNDDASNLRSKGTNLVACNQVQLFLYSYFTHVFL